MLGCSVAQEKSLCKRAVGYAAGGELRPIPHVL
jgi:hypothetical protein